MYETWNVIKKNYANQWVILGNAKYADPFHVELLGGVVLMTAQDQETLWGNIPQDYDGDMSLEYTGEEEGEYAAYMFGD